MPLSRRVQKTPKTRDGNMPVKGLHEQTRRNEEIISKNEGGVQICQNSECTSQTQCLKLHLTVKQYKDDFLSPVDWTVINLEELRLEILSRSCLRALGHGRGFCQFIQCLRCKHRHTFDWCMLIIQGWNALCYKAREEGGSCVSKNCNFVHDSASIKVYRTLEKECGVLGANLCWTYTETGTCAAGGSYDNSKKCRYVHDKNRMMEFKRCPDQYIGLPCIEKAVVGCCKLPNCLYSHNELASSALKTLISGDGSTSLVEEMKEKSGKPVKYIS